SPRAQLRAKRLDRKRPPFLRVKSALFVANPKHPNICFCRGHCFGKSAHALKQSTGITRNAADQKSDFHVASRVRTCPSPLVGSLQGSTFEIAIMNARSITVVFRG